MSLIVYQCKKGSCFWQDYSLKAGENKDFLFSSVVLKTFINGFQVSARTGCKTGFPHFYKFFLAILCNLIFFFLT